MLYLNLSTSFCRNKIPWLPFHPKFHCHWNLHPKTIFQNFETLQVFRYLFVQSVTLWKVKPTYHHEWWIFWFKLLLQMKTNEICSKLKITSFISAKSPQSNLSSPKQSLVAFLILSFRGSDSLTHALIALSWSISTAWKQNLD